jgi:fatty acid desaturase
MPAVQTVRPKDLFVAEDWATLTSVSKWRGLWLIAHGWIVTFGVIAAATWAAHPLAWLLAVVLVGGRQLGLAILMHEAAHGLTHPNRQINNFAGQWLSGAAVGSDLIAYRSYHLQHHKYTQQPEDPDLALSAPFPTSRASLMRKVARDLSGLTFLKQRRAQFRIAAAGTLAYFRGFRAQKATKDTAAGSPFNSTGAAGLSAPARDMSGAVAVAQAVGRFLVVQMILLALSLALYGWTPFLLWLAALATTFQLYLRIRNIAEHACTTTGSADPFSHARTTRANWIERATVAPYWVNFHSEHHLFMGVPCYNLSVVHRLLGRDGHHEKMTISSGYGEVLRTVVS